MNQKPNVEYSFRAGERFGRLVLTGYSTIQWHGDYKRRFVEALCDCGELRQYVFDSIRKGDTKSCGCFQRDNLRLHPNARIHGLRKHKLYKVWDGIKGRCYDKKNIGYPDYGAKGVKICDEWLRDFKAFYDWAMAAGWKKGLTVDRFPDTKGNYEPGNCRMASQRAQRLNRDDLHLITAFGETKCMKDWSIDERCKVTHSCLKNRFIRDKDDWPDAEKAITTPPQKRGFNIYNRAENKFITAFGKHLPIAEWLKDERCVADEKRIRLRIKKGWDGERILTTPVRKLPTVIVPARQVI